MTISRRAFFSAFAAGALISGTAHAGTNKRFKGYPQRRGLLHDTALCVGCRRCELACQEVNSLPLDSTPVGEVKIFEKPRGISDKLYTVVNRYRPATENEPAVFRKHQCMHCNEPCCASVCFVKAFVKTPEGPVLYDPEVCVGCRYCVFACPYYALAYEYGDPRTPRVVRCTMCYPRIKEGKIPACAEACPSGAIRFGRREELLQLARERLRKYPGRYFPEIFGENEYGGTSWLTLLRLPPEQMGLPADLPYEPLPNLTTGFLSLAPLVAAIFPGLLAGVHAMTSRREELARRQKEQELERLRQALGEKSAAEIEKLKIQLRALLQKAEGDSQHQAQGATKGTGGEENK
jgi:formate dehydrogenase iron-sulfur subunit